MNLNLFNRYRLRIGFYISIKSTEFRNGVCSRKYNSDKHMLLWDFDESDFSNIINELHRLQAKYKLPTIYILRSSENHYHAYSFTERDLQEVIHILSDTNGIDITYLRLGMARGYYTLRYSEKKGKKISLIAVLQSNYPDEMNKTDVTLNRYITTNT